MTDECLEMYYDTFDVIEGTQKNPYFIIFDAYTGMGKSYVTRALVKYGNFMVLNNDEVRMFLKVNGFPSELKEELQRDRLEKLLDLGNNCIIDSCACHNFQEKKAYYDSLEYKYYVIQLKCREEVVKERLSKRKVDGINFSTATFDDYLWMKDNVSRIDDKYIDFLVDTEDDVEKQVIEILDKINRFFVK